MILRYLHKFVFFSTFLILFWFFFLFLSLYFLLNIWLGFIDVCYPNFFKSITHCTNWLTFYDDCSFLMAVVIGMYQYEHTNLSLSVKTNQQKKICCMCLTSFYFFLSFSTEQKTKTKTDYCVRFSMRYQHWIIQLEYVLWSFMVTLCFGCFETYEARWV